MMMGWGLSTFSDSVVERERWSVGGVNGEAGDVDHSMLIVWYGWSWPALQARLTRNFVAGRWRVGHYDVVAVRTDMYEFYYSVLLGASLSFIERTSRSASSSPRLVFSK